MTGEIAFGDSDSLLGWFEDNAMRVSGGGSIAITSREVLQESGQGELSDVDFQALDILIYYADAFYSLPAYDGDGLILMSRLQLALDELATALTEMNT